MGFFDRYPYTNWHNVNLDWVLERVKEWGELVVANDQAFRDLQEANEAFKQYVTEYLQNLDIQAQIDDKLDRMFESGELTDYLQPYVSDTVTDWLEEHITEPVGVVIDSSLTVAGAAADAEATGIDVRKNESDIASVKSVNDLIELKLHELLNTITVQTGDIIAGYGNGNDRISSLNVSPFVYYRYESESSFTVNALHLKIVQIGRLTFSKVLKSDVIIGGYVDRDKFIDLHTFDVSVTGEQTLTFPAPITIEPEYYIAIGKYGDGATWYYGDVGEKGFAVVSTGTMTWAVVERSLGVNVIGTSVQTNYRKVIKSTISNKKISFLADSITTFNGYIPNGNVTYYPRDDVTNVNDTWWKKVIDACSLILDTNNSWSGSRVTTTNGDDSAGCMSRTANLGNPDIIIVYMGINDFNHEVVLGNYDGNTPIPTNTTIFANAYAIMLNKVLTHYPTAKVYACTLIPEETNLSAGFPELNSNGNSITDFNNMIKKISAIFNVDVLDISCCGLTYQNLSIYNPNMLHPNKKGHSLIANYVIDRLDNAVYTRYST